jgi:hypothetical protein
VVGPLPRKTTASHPLQQERPGARGHLWVALSRSTDKQKRRGSAGRPAAHGHGGQLAVNLAIHRAPRAACRWCP